MVWNVCHFLSIARIVSRLTQRLADVTQSSCPTLHTTFLFSMTCYDLMSHDSFSCVCSLTALVSRKTHFYLTCLTRITRPGHLISHDFIVLSDVTSCYLTLPSVLLSHTSHCCLVSHYPTILPHTKFCSVFFSQQFVLSHDPLFSHLTWPTVSLRHLQFFTQLHVLL
jgi:hypothetical protein